MISLEKHELEFILAAAAAGSHNDPNAEKAIKVLCEQLLKKSTDVDGMYERYQEIMSTPAGRSALQRVGGKAT